MDKDSNNHTFSPDSCEAQIETVVQRPLRRLQSEGRLANVRE